MKWEYREGSYRPGDYLVQELNRQGQMGWEVIKIDRKPEGYYWVLYKRPLVG
jgi:hypothetical protein